MYTLYDADIEKHSTVETTIGQNGEPVKRIVRASICAACGLTRQTCKNTYCSENPKYKPNR